MRKLLLACTALVALTGAASASTVTLGGVTWDTTNAGNLTLSATQPAGNQPQNAPCIICGANQPQQPANFGYNDYSNAGNLTTIEAFSDQGAGGRNTLGDNVIGTGYQIGSGSPFLLFLLANGDTASNLSFSIGLDINDTGTAQTLNSFYFLDLTQHIVLASFTGGTTGNVPDIANGTGFPDYTISGAGLNLLDSGVQVGDTVIFVARMSDLNDGPDSFFIEPAVAAIPEPSTWAMMILGFLGVGLFGANKRRVRPA